MSESKHTIYESRASTHADDCWGWGPKHYECALREIERLRRERDQYKLAAELNAETIRNMQRERS